MGKTRSAIAEGYIPGASAGSGRAFENHETACLLNAGEGDADVRISLFFADRDPVGCLPARRLDSRQSALALISTVAFAAD